MAWDLDATEVVEEVGVSTYMERRYFLHFASYIMLIEVHLPEAAWVNRNDVVAELVVPLLANEAAGEGVLILQEELVKDCHSAGEGEEYAHAAEWVARAPRNDQEVPNVSAVPPSEEIVDTAAAPSRSLP